MVKYHKKDAKYILGLIATEIVILFAGLLLLLVLMEVVLLFKPVQDIMPVRETNDIRHYDRRGEFAHSFWWNFSLNHIAKTNAQGFVSPRDYKPSDKNLIAVIGDEQMAAPYLPPGQRLDHQILRRVKNPAQTQVESWAAGGAGLKSYAEYIKALPDPQIAIIVIHAEDLIRDDVNYRLFTPRTTQAKILARSRTMRYLAYHLYVPFAKNLLPPLPYQTNARDISLSPPTGEDEIINDTKRFERFLEALESAPNISKSNIILVFDGILEAIYNPVRYSDVLQESRAGLMRQIAMDMARDKGFTFVDLHPVFTGYIHRKSERLDLTLPKDMVWNGAAHSITADALITLDIFQ